MRSSVQRDTVPVNHSLSRQSTPLHSNPKRSIHLEHVDSTSAVEIQHHSVFDALLMQETYSEEVIDTSGEAGGDEDVVMTHAASPELGDVSPPAKSSEAPVDNEIESLAAPMASAESLENPKPEAMVNNVLETTGEAGQSEVNNNELPDFEMEKNDRELEKGSVRGSPEVGAADAEQNGEKAGE